MTNNQHVEENVLELYALGRLAEPQLGEVEEHLLVCHACQERLEAEDQFIAAARGALVQQPPPEKEEASLWARLTAKRWTLPAGAGALALASLLLVMVFTRSNRTESVQLIARRGAENAAASVRAGSRVEMTLETAGLPESARYYIEVANQDGKAVWSGSSARTGSGMKVSVDESLAAGNYWVRIYRDAGHEDLLREFSLIAK
jgi:anti-sigma factor RsiW